MVRAIVSGAVAEKAALLISTNAIRFVYYYISLNFLSLKVLNYNKFLP
jgi:hypothetical protein